MIVQNAESVGVSRGQNECEFEAFMPRKSTFMDATVARGFMPDGTVRGYTDTAVTYHIAVFRSLSDDNIICDFIPVLEITRRL